MKRIFLLLLFIITCSQSFAGAGSRSNHPFSISLPKQWIEIPKDSITDQATLKKSPYENFNFVYKLKNSPFIFDYPCILIQVNNSRRVPQSALKSMAERKIYTVNIDTLKNLDSKFYLEQSTNRIWQKSSMIFDNGSVIRTSMIIPIQSGTLNVYCYANKDDYEKQMPELFNILTSVKAAVPDQYAENMTEKVERNSPVIVLIMTLIIIGVPTIATSALLIYKKQQEMILRLVNAILLIAIAVIIPITIAGFITKVLFIRFILFQILMLVFSLGMIYFVSKGKFSEYGFNKVSPRKIILPVINILVSGFLIVQILNLIFIILNIGSVSPFPKIYNSTYFWFPPIFAGIVEEVTVRGLFQSHLSPFKIYGIKYKSIYISVPIILSAAIFGLLHLNIGGNEIYTAFSIQQSLFAFFTGLIIAYYREKFDSIIPAIAMHMSANFMFAVLPYIIYRVVLR